MALDSPLTEIPSIPNVKGIAAPTLLISMTIVRCSSQVAAADLFSLASRGRSPDSFRRRRRKDLCRVNSSRPLLTST